MKGFDEGLAGCHARGGTAKVILETDLRLIHWGNDGIAVQLQELCQEPHDGGRL